MSFLPSHILEKTFGWPTEQSQQPEDTLQRPTPQDSIEAKVFGVDPIFIMNERRAEEIKEYQQRQQRIAIWRARQAEKEKVDTTCTICPQKPITGIHQTLQEISTSRDLATQTADYLYDINTIIPEKPVKGTVFIEAEPGKTNISKNLVKEFRAEAEGLGANWVFYPILGLFVMLAILKVFYSRFVNYFIQSSIYVFVASKLHRENSLLGRRIIFMLDFIYLSSISVFIVLALEHTNFGKIADIHPMLLVLAIFTILLLFRILRYLSVIITGVVSQTEREMKEIFFNQLIYPRILGIFLVPLLLIFTFSKGVISDSAYYIIIFSTTIMLIYRTIRSFQVFISKGFSIFYFLLYLCALEITPIVIFLKEVVKG